MPVNDRSSGIKFDAEILDCKFTPELPGKRFVPGLPGKWLFTAEFPGSDSLVMTEAAVPPERKFSGLKMLTADNFDLETAFVRFPVEFPGCKFDVGISECKNGAFTRSKSWFDMFEVWPGSRFEMFF